LKSASKHKWQNAIPHLAQALQKTLSNTDLPSYAPYGQRCGGEKDERTLRKGIVAQMASRLNEC
jgi:hypothetical protein